MTDILEIGDQSFYFVGAFEALEHVPDPNEFIKHSVRQLRSTGVVMLVVPSLHGVFEECDRVLIYFRPGNLNSFSKRTFEVVAKIHNLRVFNVC